MFFENFFAELICRQQNYSDILLRRCFSNSKCLSADVNAGMDPTFKDVMESRNASKLNYGAVITKYTGARGKGGTSDASAEYMGKNEFNPTYFIPQFETINGKTEYVMRCDFNKFQVNDGEIVAYMQNPYFNRTLEHFCSHAHAPNNPDEAFPGAVINGNIAYIGWDIFSAYANHGHLCFKELFSYIIKKMMGDETTVFADVPDRAVVTYTKQEKENRNILHLLFAHTTVRGRNTEVIEDTVPLYNVKCSVKSEAKPSKITLVPSGEEINFEYVNGRAEFTVPKVDIHQMVEIK